MKAKVLTKRRRQQWADRRAERGSERLARGRGREVCEKMHLGGREDGDGKTKKKIWQERERLNDGGREKETLNDTERERD